jgi:hypothetical protein
MQCVIAIYDDRIGATVGAEKLKEAGISNDNISMVARSIDGVDHDVKHAVQLGDDTERDAIIGAGVGGAAGLMGGSALTAVAGVLLVAGPLVALTGAIVGGLVGAIAGWGVHRDRAAEYQQKVEQGKVLLIVHGDDPLLLATAERELRLTNATEVNLHTKVDDGDDPRVDDTASVTAGKGLHLA